MISTSELVVLRAPTWHLGNAWPRAPQLCDTPRDAAEPVEGRLCHWWSWRNSGHSLPPFYGPKHESHRAGEFISLAFSSAEVIGSDQWGKQKLLSSFLTPWEGCCLYMMWLQLPDWCVYFTATALSAQSRVTQQQQQRKVYTRCYLASKPTDKITGCRYMEICETWLVMFV